MPPLNQKINRPIISPNLFWIIIVVVLLIGNVFSGIKYFSVRRELEEIKQIVKTQQINEKILSFMALFIDKVLKAEEEIGFETRLDLENAVRVLDDDEALNQWQKFVDSKTEEEAQNEVKILLEVLVKKIVY